MNSEGFTSRAPVLPKTQIVTSTQLAALVYAQRARIADLELDLEKAHTLIANLKLGSRELMPAIIERMTL